MISHGFSIHSFYRICSAHAKEFFKIALRRKLHHFHEFPGLIIPVSACLFTGADAAADLRRASGQIKLLRFLFPAKRIIHFLPPVPARSDL